MILTGINIRSGLELEVPVSEIFSVNIAPDGNILAKQYFNATNRKEKKLLGEVKKQLETDQIILYNDLKINQKLSDSLCCYVYDSYFIYEDEKNNGQIKVEKNNELLFVNTELLNFEQYCQNFMIAQSFTGNFERPEFNYPFIGVGSFDLDEYIDLHPLCSYSNLNLVNFFIYHKKILSSIGYFICGLFENDIKDQRKYVNEDEYKQLMNLVKKQKRTILNAFKDMNKDDPEMGFDF